MNYVNGSWLGLRMRKISAWESGDLLLNENWTSQTLGFLPVRPTHNVSDTSVTVEPPGLPIADPTNKHNKGIGLGFGISGPAFFCAFLVAFGYTSVKKWQKMKVVKGLKEFGYKELSAATKGFHSSRIIGRCTFGNVYEAYMISTGTLAAVKRSKHSHEGSRSLAELSLQHV